MKIKNPFFFDETDSLAFLLLSRLILNTTKCIESKNKCPNGVYHTPGFLSRMGELGVRAK
jgi:hypothetical protein